MLEVSYAHNRNINHADIDSYTALHHAISCDGVEAVRWLLDHDVDYQHTDTTCISPTTEYD